MMIVVIVMIGRGMSPLYGGQRNKAKRPKVDLKHGGEGILNF